MRVPVPPSGYQKVLRIADPQLDATPDTTLPVLESSEIETDRLLDLLPDLGDGLSAVVREAARARSQVVVRRFERGQWDPARVWVGRHPAFALLLVDGMLIRELAVGGLRSAVLFGAGDLILRQPSSMPEQGASERWRALVGGRVARLDARLLARLAMVGLTLDVLAYRSAERGRLLGTIALTRAMRRTDARLMTTLMALAARWGRVCPSGIRLTLPASHEQLAALIGTRRQAVTTALGQLRAAGRLSSLPGGDWLLSADPCARTAHAPLTCAGAAGATNTGGHVSLLAFDHRVAAGVPEEQRAEAAVRLRTPTAYLRRGRWCPNVDAGAYPDWLGLLILEGFLTRESRFEDRAALEILGPGDLLRPWDDEADGLLDEVRWRALVHVRLALLDGHLARRASAWPAVLAELLARPGHRARWFNARLLTNEHAHVEARIEALLSRLATRWATTDALTVPVALTHSQIANLVGAQRPSVTNALHRLRADGALSLLPDGRWQLAAAIGCAGAPAPVRGRRELDPRGMPTHQARRPQRGGEGDRMRTSASVRSR